jgi:uncharacterized protein
MKIVGHVESLWRYPVKSMRGEALTEAFVAFPGIYGDRFYAFHDAASTRTGFPYLNAPIQPQMLLYRPKYRHPERVMKPVNLAEAEALEPGVTPIYGSEADFALDVENPAGQTFSIDDPRLFEQLTEGLRSRHELSVLRSQRALTDCRPVSLFSLQTLSTLSQEIGVPLDKRRFRSNIYLNLADETGFGEDQLVRKTLRIGAKAEVAVVGRDPRCKMITLDPDTAEQNPEIMRQVARLHDGNAGVYAAVVVEGTIRPGDQIVVSE